MPKVTIIPQTLNRLNLKPLENVTKKKVAAYARVSTDSEEQETSYEAQCQFYTEKIRSNVEWEFAGMYADEGITGTSTKRRVEFNRMIEDALNNKIDIILCKSVSRFARNTIDTLTYSRQLKAKGVEIIFEKENLSSLDPKTDFILTIMSSIAQEESRSISSNVAWGKRVAASKGKIYVPVKNFLGWKKDQEGNLVIDENEAELVREIYRMFLKEGLTSSAIAKSLKERGILTARGKNCEWTKTVVDSILTNEKYKGDCLLQKGFVADYLDHRVVKNRGELPQYYVTNSHPAIIEPEEWNQVQDEIKRRKAIGACYSGYNFFSSKLICGDCGGIYGKKVWHSQDKYRKEIYQCNDKFNKKHDLCKTTHFTEEEIITMFIKAYNLSMTNKEQVIQDARDAIKAIDNSVELDGKIKEASDELEILHGLIEKLIEDNKTKAQNQAEYEKRYNDLYNRHMKAKNKIDKLKKEQNDIKNTIARLNAFVKNMKEADVIINKWDNDIWMLMVDKAIVNRDESITFNFTNGKQIKIYR